MGYESLKDEAAVFTERFKYLFRIKFGTQPVVHYTLGLPFYGKIKLDELINICSEVMNSKLPRKVEEGIKCKRRLREIVEYRQCYFKLARDLGYSWSVMGKSIGYNHATAIHSYKKIIDRLDNGDKYANLVMRNIQNAIYDYQLAAQDVVETYERETFTNDGNTVQQTN
jgi:hypothetical protein